MPTTTAFHCEACEGATPAKFRSRSEEFECAWCEHAEASGGNAALERAHKLRLECGCVVHPVHGCPCDVREELDEAALELAEA